MFALDSRKASDFNPVRFETSIKVSKFVTKKCGKKYLIINDSFSV